MEFSYHNSYDMSALAVTVLDFLPLGFWKIFLIMLLEHEYVLVILRSLLGMFIFIVQNLHMCSTVCVILSTNVRDRIMENKLSWGTRGLLP